MRVIASTPTRELESPEEIDETVDSATDAVGDAATDVASTVETEAREFANTAAEAAAEVRDTVDAMADKMAERVEDVEWKALWGRATDEIRQRALAALGWTLVIDEGTPTAEVRPSPHGWRVDTTGDGDATYDRKREAMDHARDWARSHDGVLVVHTADNQLQQTVHYCR